MAATKCDNCGRDDIDYVEVENSPPERIFPRVYRPVNREQGNKLYSLNYKTSLNLVGSGNIDPQTGYRDEMYLCDGCFNEMFGHPKYFGENY